MTQPVSPFRGIAQTTVSLAGGAATGRVALPVSAIAYLVTNEGPSTAFFNFGDVNVVSTVPAGATAGSTPIPAGAVEVFRPPVTPPTHFSAITSAGAATLYITAGEGS